MKHLDSIRETMIMADIVRTKQMIDMIGDHPIMGFSMRQKLESLQEELRLFREELEYEVPEHRLTEDEIEDYFIDIIDMGYKITSSNIYIDDNNFITSKSPKMGYKLGYSIRIYKVENENGNRDFFDNNTSIELFSFMDKLKASLSRIYKGIGKYEMAMNGGPDIDITIIDNQANHLPDDLNYNLIYFQSGFLKELRSNLSRTAINIKTDMVRNTSDGVEVNCSNLTHKQFRTVIEKTKKISEPKYYYAGGTDRTLPNIEVTAIGTSLKSEKRLMKVVYKGEKPYNRN